MNVVRVAPAHIARIIRALDEITADPGTDRGLALTLQRFANLVRPDVNAQPNDVKMRANLVFYAALRDYLVKAPASSKWDADTVIQTLDYFDTLDRETP